MTTKGDAAQRPDPIDDRAAGENDPAARPPGAENDHVGPAGRGPQKKKQLQAKQDWHSVVTLAARLLHLSKTKDTTGSISRATAVQSKRGKLAARERLGVLLDEGSFVEIDQLRRHRAYGLGMEEKRPHSDGVITGWGTVEGRKVFVFAHDFSVFGGSLGETFAMKIHKVMDLAMMAGAPIVGINDGAGARIQEGVNALAGYGGIFRRNVRASGVVPQINVMAGPCAGGAAYSPALTDFVIMVKDISNMFVTGPDVVRTVSGEDVTTEELGGAAMHARTSGVATFMVDDEKASLNLVRELLGYLPSNNRQQPPYKSTTDPPNRRNTAIFDIVPPDPRKPYDVKKVIREIVDDGQMLEMSSRWARNVVCALARLDGHVVGIVGNQPNVMAGALNIAASEKAARFVRSCDAFNIPLVSLVDVPGFLPGTAQEHDGLIRRGAKLLYAYCDASVARIQLIMRKAYGGAYLVMDSKSVGADFSFAWPINQVAVMGSEAAVEVIYGKELRSLADPSARRAELIGEYEDQLMGPYLCAEQGHVDDIIDPADTRATLIRTLDILREKNIPRPERRHGNIPL